MQIIPEPPELSREEIRQLEDYKDLTDEQVDKLITVASGWAEVLYALFEKEQKSIIDNRNQYVSRCVDMLKYTI